MSSGNNVKFVMSEHPVTIKEGNGGDSCGDGGKQGGHTEFLLLELSSSRRVNLRPKNT